MSPSPHRTALRLVLLYVAISGVYIILSDRLLASLTADPQVLTSLQTLKGWVFVASTGALLYLLVRRALVKVAHRDVQVQLAEHALRQTETALRLQSAALETADYAVAIADHTGRIMWVNSAFTRLTGYTTAEALAQTLRWDRSATRDGPADQEMWETLLAGRPWRGESPAYRKDGSSYVEAQTITPLRDETGGISHLIAIKQDVTSRTQAEAALAEERNLLRTLIDNLPDYIFIKDAESRFVMINSAQARLLGVRSPEEAVGKTDVDFLPAAVAMQYRADEERVVRTGEPLLDGEERGPHLTSGEVEWHLTTKLPLRNAQEKIVGIVGISRNITEIKRAELALLRRTRQLEAIRVVSAEITRELHLAGLLDLITRRAAELVGAVSGGLYLWDAERHALVSHASISSAGPGRHRVRRLGEGVAGTAAQRRQGIIVNDYRTSPFATPESLARPGLTAVIGEPLLYREQPVGVIALDNEGPGHRFTAEDGEVLALFAAQAAIAVENARLYEAARREQREAEILAGVAKKMNASLDLDTVLQEVVEGARELCGSDLAEIALRESESDAVVLRYSAGTLPETLPRLRIEPGKGVGGQILLTGMPFRTDHYAEDPRFTKDYLPRARQRGVATELGVPIRIDKAIEGLIFVNNCAPRAFTDRDEATLLRLADQAAVAIRNAQLYADVKRSLENLKQAQDELLRSEKLRALGQMSVGVAHDLNNTLAAILGQVELMQLQTTDPELRESLGILDVAATDGAQVVRRLQGFARQQPAGALVPSDLAHAVSEALEITRPRWRDEVQHRGHVIQVETSLNNLPPVWGQASEIREALTNLILNAVDAMPEGGALRIAARETTVGTHRMAAPSASPLAHAQQVVELTFTDTGVGMTEAVRHRVFEPFFTTKGGHGTGLGLSMVYGIMERHGGQIDVASTPGHGTTFTLRFRSVPADTPTGRTAPPRRRPSRRLLVIDDDPQVRKTVAGLLRVAGHLPIEAEGGREGLARFVPDQIDLVLTDLGMPDVNGWDVAAAVKARHPACPVILLTGWGERQADEQTGRDTVDRVLNKPVRLQELLQVIAELTPDP